MEASIELEIETMKRQISEKTRRIGWLLLPILLAVICGCGRTSRVTGKVTYQGRSVKYGSVIFLSADKTARSGVIEPDGSYAIEGVPPGTVKIAVISRDPRKGRSAARGRKPVHPGEKGTGTGAPAPEGWFPLPPALEDPQKSGQTGAIGSGNVSYEIDLK